MPQLQRRQPQKSIRIAATKPSRAGDVAALAFLTGLGVLVYFNSFEAPFVFDGVRFIRNIFNPDRFWPWQLPYGGNRPVGLLSFSLNYTWDELNVWSYHAVNVAIHVLAAWVLYAIVRRTLARPPLAAHFGAASRGLALVAAAIWLVHPLQTECVTNLYQRLESLMGLFYLLTLFCFIRAQDSRSPVAWFAASVVVCALGMATKEVMISAPLVVLWYDRAFVASSWRELLRSRGMYYAALAGTWMVLCVAMVRGAPENEASGLLFVKGLTPFNYAWSQPGVIVHYLRLCFWPSDLCLDYGWPVADDWTRIVPPALFLAALVAGTVWCIWRRPAVGFLGGAFFLILAPTSSIAPIRDLAAEHRMYLPLAAVAVLATVGAYQAWQLFVGRTSDASQPRKKLPIAIFAGSLAVAVLAALGYRTVIRNQDYQSELAIWRDTAAKSPQNPRAHRNFAEELFKNGQSVLALEELNRAIEAKSDDAEAFNNRGIVRQNLGNLKLALADFSRAVDLGYGADAYFNRADLYMKRLQFDRAIEDLSEAISLESKINGRSGSAARQKAAASYLRRGGAYQAIPRPELALADYSQAIAIEPADADAYLGRGRVHQSLGKYRAAKEDFDMALRLAPNHPFVLNARAWLLATCPDARMRDGKQALADANLACRVTNRESAECLETLAAACAERDDFKSAIQWETAAIRLTTDDARFGREAQRRLEMYRAGKPYRDAPAKQSPSARQSSE